MPTILIVDDDRCCRGYLLTLLGRRGYRLLEADDGAAGLALARSATPDLIITDILMPSMDGYEFVRQLRTIPAIAATPVIFWSATYLESEAATLAGHCGVSQILTKPCDPETVLRTVQEALHAEPHAGAVPRPSHFYREHLRILTNKLLQKVEDLEAARRQLQQSLDETRKAHHELADTYEATLEGWVRALDLRDYETEGHTQRVTELTVRLARAMGVAGEDLIRVRRGALLHDIGKLGVPDRILHKRGPLDEQETRLMRMHPVYARQMLEPIPFLRSSMEIPYLHHERWDGTGYPTGLKGEQIPLAARIFAVADVYDALRSDRPYHSPVSESEARQYIHDQSGRHFDPHVVRSFLALGP
ncbi:MAG TPA: HD domain-containing phosphohydrolase [Gemmataceae bacterium]|nr:HD domain-containing phosphohydrolase [Gemmataceae bacterium]